jgi:hypothetical protein
MLAASRVGPVLLLAALALAGCISTGSAPKPLATPSDAMAMDMAPFTLTGTNCEEGGFVAAYNAQGGPLGGPGNGNGSAPMLSDTWTLADIRDEIGQPIHDAVGSPANGPMVGNWHMGFHCATASGSGGSAKDYLFGYVGDMIQPPAWDPPGADVEYVVSGLGFQNGTIADALRNTTMADVTPAAEASVQWYVPKELPRSAAYVRYVDGEKGVYESWSTMALLRTQKERTIRLWWQVPVNGTMDHGAHHNAHMDLTFNRLDMDMQGEWHPVYWDIHVSSAQQYTTPPMDGVELASHNMLQFEHGPIPAQPTLTDVYEYGKVTFTSGHVIPDVVLTKMWNH